LKGLNGKKEKNSKKKKREVTKRKKGERYRVGLQKEKDAKRGAKLRKDHRAGLRSK